MSAAGWPRRCGPAPWLGAGRARRSQTLSPLRPRSMPRSPSSRAGHTATTSGRNQTLAQAQQAVAATLLWDLRAPAGWLPRDGVDWLRVLAGWFESRERR